MKKKLLLVTLILFGLTVLSFADTVSLSPAQLATFNFTATGSTPGTTGSVISLPTGAQLQAILPTIAGGTAVFEWTGSLSIGAGDTFALNYLNSNSNDWTWTLAIYDTSGTNLVGVVDLTSVGPNATDLLSVFVASATTIDRITLTVTGSFPTPDPGDRIPNSTITTVVPEPSSLILLGLGLLGIPTILRLKSSK